MSVVFETIQDLMKVVRREMKRETCLAIHIELLGSVTNYTRARIECLIDSDPPRTMTYIAKSRAMGFEHLVDAVMEGRYPKLSFVASPGGFVDDIRVEKEDALDEIMGILESRNVVVEAEILSDRIRAFVGSVVVMYIPRNDTNTISLARRLYASGVARARAAFFRLRQSRPGNNVLFAEVATLLERGEVGGTIVAETISDLQRLSEASTEPTRSETETAENIDSAGIDEQGEEGSEISDEELKQLEEELRSQGIEV